MLAKTSWLPLCAALCLGAGALSAQKAASGKKVIVYTSAEGTELRLTPTDTLGFSPHAQPIEREVTVFVDPTKSFQTFLGIGGAITDASAETFSKMPAAQQEEILNAYYDPKQGIGYSLARTNIHSCDFSSASYTYVQEGDKDLKTFSIEHDKAHRIPMIKKAIAKAGGKLTLYASPWTPPAFMKDNNDLLHGGKLKPEFYQSWADYYVKFINAYEKEGIPVWGISIQNEPMAVQRWESCIYTGEEERDFLKNYLGPTLQKRGLGNKKIIGWDHNRDLMYQRAWTILSDPEAAKYLWGIGFHWYETWTGGAMQYNNVGAVYEAFPKTNLIFTEGCKENFKLDKIGDWSLGERYARSMINDFNNGTVAWTDWNILLDETGGPNHVQNLCFAPIHGNTQTGKVLYTNSYYYIGHFSKFIRPGAKRLASTSSRSSLLATSFLNEDGKVATVVMNEGNEAVQYAIWVEGQVSQLSIPPHAIQTLIF